MTDDNTCYNLFQQDVDWNTATSSNKYFLINHTKQPNCISTNSISQKIEGNGIYLKLFDQEANKFSDESHDPLPKHIHFSWQNSIDKKKHFFIPGPRTLNYTESQENLIQENEDAFYSAANSLLKQIELSNDEKLKKSSFTNYLKSITLNSNTSLIKYDLEDDAFDKKLEKMWSMARSYALEEDDKKAIENFENCITLLSSNYDKALRSSDIAELEIKIMIDSCYSLINEKMIYEAKTRIDDIKNNITKLDQNNINFLDISKHINSIEKYLAGEFDEATKSMFSLTKKLPVDWSRIGALHANIGLHEHAISYYELAIDQWKMTNPSGDNIPSRFLYNKAISLLAINQKEAAKTIIECLITKNPNNWHFGHLKNLTTSYH